MSKTPYEIRSELIQAAQEHIAKQYELNVSYANTLANAFLASTKLPENMSIEELVKYQQEMIERFKSMYPVMPSTDDIMKRATELYSFVCKKE